MLGLCINTQTPISDTITMPDKLNDPTHHVQLPEGQPILRMVPMPSDTNYAGDIFGGWIMSQVDMAGSVPALRRAHGRVATVAVNSFVFKQPVCVGDLVSFYADIIKVGRTSITVDVAVYAQRGVREGGEEVCIKVTEAVLTYVAIDSDRRPRPVPQE
ncbi:acyl-CoA thioesterase YciA [Nitrosomonas ureae]|uniref:Acyl-CoA thioesterase YciA n=2 Tax=Nitrosomonas ureae TaxID=44577 RepID=A0A286A521_9PROT|nr:acyl-CoA thioesterase YciA [Nitrosomonas ureae]